MPLFHIQDGDRPAWIIANTFGQAVEKWQEAVESENDFDTEKPMPDGVQLVCEDSDIIVGHDWLA